MNKYLPNIPKCNWYQCDIITTSGEIDYWCRFIAKDTKTARENIESIYTRTLHAYTVFEKKILKKKIAAIRITKVPKSILKKYDMNNMIETERFYRKERG